jgi:hypothetical protein
VNLPAGLGTATLDSITCPTTAGGAVQANYTMVVPASAPGGLYQVGLSTNDQSGANAYCIQVDFTLT